MTDRRTVTPVLPRQGATALGAEKPESDPRAAAKKVALEFVERWAGLTKTVAIYPPTSDRVRHRVDALLAALEQLLALAPAGEGANSVLVAFGSHHVVVGPEVLEYPSPGSLSWLKSRLDPALLAGVEFHRGLAAEPLVAFTRRLLELAAASSRTTDFPTAWPEAYPGLTVLDRRFEGGFLGCGPDGDAGPFVRSWGPGGSLALDTRNERQVAGIVAQDPEVAERMNRLATRLAARGEAGGGQGQIDLIGRIVKLMPADARVDFAVVLQITKQVLTALENRTDSLLEDGGAAALRESEMLRSLVLASGLGLFGRKGPSAPEIAAKAIDVHRARPQRDDALPGKGHIGDDAITDDLPKLLEEWQRLPEADLALDARSAQDPAEQVGVYLHFLVHAASDAAADRVHRPLAKILDRPTAEGLEVLRTYLHHEDPPAQARIFRFFLHTRLGRVLRSTGVITLETARASFPNHFGVFIDALDLATAEDLAVLENLFAGVSEEQFEAAADHLIAEEGLLDPERAARILKSGSRVVRPLARIMVGRGNDACKALVVHYLRGLKLESAAASPLWVVDDPRFLPRKVLIAIMDQDGGRKPSLELQHRIASTLCHFIRGTSHDPEQLPRRIYAINNLAFWPTDEGRDLLTELVSARRSFFLAREPRAVRRAARDVLRTWRGR